MTATVDASRSTGLDALDTRVAALELFIDGVLVRDVALPEACRVFVRGGKRLRARLVLACACDADASEPELLLGAAAAIELFHAASLIHDDIVDGAETRRHQPAMHGTAGVRHASLSGWYLGQLALMLMAELPHAARERFAEAGQAMSRGQLAEIMRAWDTTLLPEDRLTIMEQKTAAVFGLACELGGMLSGADSAACTRLRRLGEAFGMLFQIADDVDDLYASPDELGRAPGADLGAGVISLLGASALQSEARDEAAALLARGLEGGADEVVDRCRTLMRSSGALDEVHAAAEGYAASARRHLRVLPATAGAVWMRGLVDATVRRITRYANGA